MLAPVRFLLRKAQALFDRRTPSIQNEALKREIAEQQRVLDSMREAQAQLQAKSDSLTIMNAVADSLHSSLDFQTVGQLALDFIADYTNAPAATLYFYDDQTTTLKLLAVRRLDWNIAETSPKVHYPGTLSRVAVTQKQIAIAEDVQNDPRIHANIRQTFIDNGFKSAVAIPLMMHERVLGTIGLMFSETRSLTPEEQTTLFSIGRTIALAIANAQHVTRIETEVEERRKVELALRAAEEKYRSIYENAVEGIFQITPDGRFLNANPAMAKILGYDSAEQLINEVTDVVHQLYVNPDHSRVMAEMLEREGYIHFESQHYRRDGSIIMAVHHTRVVRDEQGAILYYEGIVDDITERKRLQQREIELAIALERERVEILKAFLHNTTHDLRTPLSIMNTSLHLLGKTMGDPDRQRHYIGQIAEQTQRMHAMIENMFTLSRLDTGVAEYDFEPCSINEVVQEVWHKQKLLIAHKQHQVMLDLMPDTLKITIDRDAIITALRHIFVNALNYTDSGGQICLRTYRRDQGLVIEITDNGMGIGKEDLPRIFERFYRADKARQIDTGTSGLGLTIAQKLVHAHGGKIEVESQPSVGSTFRLVLPYL